MRNDIQPYEHSFSSKEVAEQAGIATPTVRKYGQILERNGYVFLKEGDRRIFVQSDIEALIALRDTDKPLDDTAKEIARQQKERLKGFGGTEIAVADTYENLPQDPNHLKEILSYLANELAATREMNVQLISDMADLKTTVSRLKQDHHDLSSNISNSAQKTQARIEKLSEQEKIHYETLLEEEKQKSEYLQGELQNLREEMKKEWLSQNDFNKRIEKSIQRPKDKWERIFSIFRK
jgi:DNA-binding transcriptional regulator YhcF (GntR family)